MKYFCVMILALLVAGCTKTSRIEFTGNTPGINEGVFTIKTINDSIFFTTAIKQAKFAADTALEQPGYYLMMITSPDKGTQVFDIYLEDGKYTVTTNKDMPFKYPDIQTNSKLQNQLTAYYHLSGDMSEQARKTTQDITAKLNDAKVKSLPPNVYTNLQTRLKEATLQESKLSTIVLNAFVDKYPDTEIVPHIMLNMNYPDDPAAFNNVFQKLSPAAKNSGPGKQMAHWLEYYLTKGAGK